MTIEKLDLIAPTRNWWFSGLMNPKALEFVLRMKFNGGSQFSSPK